MRRQIRRELRLLRWWTGASTIVLVFVAATAVIGQGTVRGTRFDEISVERINIIESDGRVRLVIANAGRQADAVIDGKTIAPGRGRPAGMIFFNDIGDEVGGLVFNGRPQNGRTRAMASLTFDQWKQDQTVALQYVDENGQRRAGLSVIDRPETSLATYAELVGRVQSAKTDAERGALSKEQATIRAENAQRMFVGKDVDGRATLALSDAQGRQRLVMAVERDGRASIQFLDAAGKVVREVMP